MAEILIVDDDREICSVLKEILEEEGYHVDYVTSGDEALIEIDKGNYDTVTLRFDPYISFWAIAGLDAS